jgi:hypothetical protein
MTIRRVHGAGAVAKAGLEVGKRKAEKEASIRAAQVAEQRRAQQEAQQYREAIRKQDFAIDLEMRERAKVWELDKMQLRSQMDFQREEADRQRKLTNIDNKLTQLEKEKDSGRFSADETAYANAVSYWQAQKDFIETGVRPPAAQKQFGVQPHWMRGRDAPVGSPERQLYEAKMQQQISGQRTGTVPWYLDPRHIGTKAAEQAREERGIFLEPEDIEEFTGGEAMPTVTTDAEYDALPSGAEFTDLNGRRWRKP